ncbi:MAG: hypothetical protein ABEK59_12165 [Halobacteria archaeon]
MVLDKRYGQPYITDYIFDETLTLTLNPTGNPRIAIKLGERLLDERWIELNFVS